MMRGAASAYRCKQATKGKSRGKSKQAGRQAGRQARVCGYTPSVKGRNVRLSVPHLLSGRVAGRSSDAVRVQLEETLHSHEP